MRPMRAIMIVPAAGDAATAAAIRWAAITALLAAAALLASLCV